MAVAVLVTLKYVGGFLNPGGTGQGLPIASVNEDAGATIGGKPVRFGDEVLNQATSPNPALGANVRWTVLGNRQEALAEIRKNRFDAAIVIPADYSAQIAALLNPVVIASEPATIELLTNPAAGSLAWAEAQQIVTGVVGAIFAATNAQLVQTVRATGVNVSPEASSILGNPVQAKVTVA
jgi:YhgE/Pip-like protein